MAFDDLPEEGKKAILEFVRALARRRSRLDFAEDLKRLSTERQGGHGAGGGSERSK